MTKVFILGYPGDMGGANTECWHTVKLWRKHGVEVHFIPTWGYEEKWKEKLDAIGCVTDSVHPDNLEKTPGLEGSITVGFCNSEYIMQAARLRNIGCKIVWVNCMTFMFDYERRFFEEHGPVDAMIYQSEFQRSEIEPQLQSSGYDPSKGHLIHGAFDYEAWEFEPQKHEPGMSFVIGRAARPDEDKWSSNTWRIYSSIQYENKKALMLGIDNRTMEKLGPPPEWASCLRPMAIEAKRFYSCLHALLPVNGGARENWPRAGLEAFATGVPVVAQNEWGWREMIEHGVTGFLGSNDSELAHYTAMLAYDEELRMRIIENARKRLIEQHANPDTIWEQWKNVFHSLGWRMETFY
jgi:glycosyltransferase involved in cell wall biosynthesis